MLTDYQPADDTDGREQANTKGLQAELEER
jgi:hypothetical protein